MKIALSICGSISAYKSLDLARSLVKSGHSVRVILSHGALEFVKPEVYSYLGVERTYLPQDDFKHSSEKDPQLGNTVLHIGLSKWADIAVTAPLSANTLSHLSSGGAKDLMSSLFLAWDQQKPWIFFPAMNTKMLHHPFVKKNLKKLETLPSSFIHPSSSGVLACGEIGEGKLPEIRAIHNIIESYPHSLQPKNKKHVLITTGATLSPLDPVRYLTNPSSGKTGLYLAKEALAKGHQVTVVAGELATDELNDLISLPNFHLCRVVTTEDMFQEVHKYLPQADYYISAAAINDIQFPQQDEKIKKDQLSSTLKIETAKDVLQSVLKIKRPDQKIISFAAETDFSPKILLEKFDKKPVDILVGTKVHSGLNKGNEQSGFFQDQATYQFIIQGQVQPIQTMSKKELAQGLLQNL
jgi:phosphopantothenoylcysteine decarboxylase / phosphopantothenate---cysteine ligase